MWQLFRENRCVISSLSPYSPDLEVADGLQIGWKCCKVAAHAEEGEEKLKEEGAYLTEICGLFLCLSPEFFF